ncbi:hypothetical protein [Nesterenkonia suensis]
MASILAPPEWERLEDIAEVQQDAREQGSKLDAVAHFAEHFPHLPSDWVARHLDMLLGMDPEQLVSVIGYPDPTGERAARNADREREW